MKVIKMTRPPAAAHFKGPGIFCLPPHGRETRRSRQTIKGGIYDLKTLKTGRLIDEREARSSGRRDSNARSSVPKTDTLPGYATPCDTSLVSPCRCGRAAGNQNLTKPKDAAGARRCKRPHSDSRIWTCDPRIMIPLFKPTKLYRPLSRTIVSQSAHAKRRRSRCPPEGRGAPAGPLAAWRFPPGNRSQNMRAAPAGKAS
jgi:hypothetical protein